MQTLNDLMDRSIKLRSKGLNAVVEMEDILAIVEAFRDLERRLEVAEQGEKTFEDGFCSVRQDRDEWKQRAEAVEAKLAGLEKQEPSARVISPPTYISQTDKKLVYEIETELPMKPGCELFTRPAPAADLAELLPPKKELASDTKNLQACEWGFHLQDEGWNKCIDAVIKNIEEAK